jgi:hypothetical protein
MRNNKVKKSRYIITINNLNSTITIRNLFKNTITTNKLPSIIMLNKLFSIHIIIIMLRNKKQKNIIEAMNNFCKLMKKLESIMKSITTIHIKLLQLKKRNLINILTNTFTFKNIITLIMLKLRNQNTKSIIINNRHNQK